MKYKRKFIAIFFFVGVLFSMLFLAEKKYNRSSLYFIQEKGIWILNQKNANYDVAFLGSSRVHNIIDPILADSLLSANTINLGIGGAAFPENYLVLQQFLKTNKIKTLALQVDMSGIIPGEQAYSHPFS